MAVFDPRRFIIFVILLLFRSSKSKAQKTKCQSSHRYISLTLFIHICSTYFGDETFLEQNLEQSNISQISRQPPDCPRVAATQT